MKSIKTIEGKHIKVSGNCWKKRYQIEELIIENGGIYQKDRVTKDTDIFVRGENERFRYGTYGRREEEAKKKIQQGQAITVVDDSEFRKLLEEGKPARCSDTIAGELIEDIVNKRPSKSKPKKKKGKTPSEAEFVRIEEIPGALDREYTTNGRLEQSYLRNKLFGTKKIAKCSIRGMRLPVELLVAAHIKLRSKCTREERLDAENIVFALCLLGCDALYEKGFISVNNNKKVVATDISKTIKDLYRALKKLKGKKCVAWTNDSSVYFLWHFENRFQV